VRSPRTPLVYVALGAAAATVIALAPAQAAKSSASSATTSAQTADAAGRTMAAGAEVKPTGSQSDQQAITAFETTTGHKLAFTRDYLLWNSPFPTSYEDWLGARGTMPLISVNPKMLNGTPVKWATVANAQPGSSVYNAMKAWADKVKAFGYPVYFIYNHEPEAASSSSFGTAADFIAAWRNFHSVFDAEGVTNAKWMWTMTAFAFIVSPSDRRYAWKWYPGDAYVDAIGADAYTAFTCDNPGGIWHPLSYQLAGFVTFGGQHPTKPQWLPEWGVVEDPAQPGRKAQWITDAHALFKGAAYSQFVGIAYFNETRPGTACDWRVSTSSSAQAAYNALAQDPFYQGIAALPSSDSTPPTASITSPANGASVSGTVPISADASDNVAVSSVGFYADGALVSTDATTPYTGSLNTTGLTNGTHSLTAIATDTGGNSTTSAAVSVTVNNAPPPGCPATPPGATELSGNRSLESNQSGWTGLYNGNSVNSRIQVAGGSFDGSYALQLTAKSGTSGPAGVNNVNPTWVPGSPGLATTAGGTYVGVASVKAAVAGQSVSLLVRETLPDGTGLNFYAVSTVTLNDTAWHTISTTYVARNSGNSIRYSLYGTFTSSSQRVFADCLSLQSS
jgi:Bacterial Ig domain/Glycosyl hydrolase family 26